MHKILIKNEDELRKASNNLRRQGSCTHLTDYPPESYPVVVVYIVTTDSYSKDWIDWEYVSLDYFETE